MRKMVGGGVRDFVYEKLAELQEKTLLIKTLSIPID
jgi:hypothetical protein